MEKSVGNPDVLFRYENYGTIWTFGMRRNLHRERRARSFCVPAWIQIIPMTIPFLQCWIA